MTKNRVKKQAARRRMAATGESFVQATAKHEAARSSKHTVFLPVLLATSGRGKEHVRVVAMLDEAKIAYSTVFVETYGQPRLEVGQTELTGEHQIASHLSQVRHLSGAGNEGYPSFLEVAEVISGTRSFDRLLQAWPEHQPSQAVPGDTSPRGQLVTLVERWLLGNFGRETSDASYSLDLGFELAEEWLKTMRLEHRLPLKVGDLVRFDGEHTAEWEVRASIDGFAFCVQEAGKKPTPSGAPLRHTLIAWEANLRGEGRLFQGREAIAPQEAEAILDQSRKLGTRMWAPYGHRKELVIASLRGALKSPARSTQASLYGLCEDYSAGKISREQLLKALLSWEYVPIAPISDWNEALVHPEGSLADLERALRRGLLDDAIFDEVMDALANDPTKGGVTVDAYCLSVRLTAEEIARGQYT